VIAEGDLSGALTASTRSDLGDLFSVNGTHDLAFKWSDANSISYSSSVVYVTQAPDLAISNVHVGTFKQGDSATNIRSPVNNDAGTLATSGTVTVTDTLPSGLTPTAAAGTAGPLKFPVRP